MQDSIRDTDVKNRLGKKKKEQTWNMWERSRVGQLDRITLKHVCYICKIDDQCKFDG